MRMSKSAAFPALVCVTLDVAVVCKWYITICIQSWGLSTVRLSYKEVWISLVGTKTRNGQPVPLNTGIREGSGCQTMQNCLCWVAEASR